MACAMQLVLSPDTPPNRRGDSLSSLSPDTPPNRRGDSLSSLSPDTPPNRRGGSLKLVWSHALTYSEFTVPRHSPKQKGGGGVV